MSVDYTQLQNLFWLTAKFKQTMWNDNLKIIIIILRFLQMLSYGEPKLTTSCVLLSMSTMSTSNFEYE